VDRPRRPLFNGGADPYRLKPLLQHSSLAGMPERYPSDRTPVMLALQGQIASAKLNRLYVVRFKMRDRA